MEELQVIKKELTLIKTQIDGLLDSLDRMDTHTGEHKGEAFIPKSLRWQIGAGEVKWYIIYFHVPNILRLIPLKCNISDFCSICCMSHTLDQNHSGAVASARLGDWGGVYLTNPLFLPPVRIFEMLNKVDINRSGEMGTYGSLITCWANSVLGSTVTDDGLKLNNAKLERHNTTRTHESCYCPRVDIWRHYSHIGTRISFWRNWINGLIKKNKKST